MANSGVTKTQINSLERATSSDVNSIQTNIATALMEIFRYQWGIDRSNVAKAADNIIFEQPYDGTSSPSDSCRVIGGLLINPQTNGILIDAGALVIVETSPDADESPFTYARSDGVSSLGTFPFVPNAGAGPRWDLVECRPEIDTTTENRDIFDPINQTFTNTSVDKIITTSLEFQLNLGTPASPSPAPTVTPGWQPLCAVWVPNTAVDWDGCEFFDIRPVVSGMSDPNGGYNNQNASSLLDDPVKSAYIARSVVTGTSGTYSHRTEVAGDVVIDRAIQSQFDTSNPNVGAIASYSIFGKKGYSAQFPYMSTNPQGSNGDPFEPFIGSGADGAPSDYCDIITVINQNTIYNFGIVIPFGFARFHKYSNYLFNGRRWPLLVPGLFLVTTGLRQLGPNIIISSGLPRAYDTAGFGFENIILGAIESGPFGNGIHSTNGQTQTWDGWWRGFSTTSIPILQSDVATASSVEWTDFSVPSQIPFSPIRCSIRFQVETAVGIVNSMGISYFNGSKRAGSTTTVIGSQDGIRTVITNGAITNPTFPISGEVELILNSHTQLTGENLDNAMTITIAGNGLQEFGTTPSNHSFTIEKINLLTL